MSLTAIHPQAQIGENVQIAPFTMIEKDVVIGPGTWIGPHVTICEGARIGAHCQIFSGAVIAAVPQDLKFSGEKTTVTIGDHTIVREYVTINRGTKVTHTTTIGQHSLLMAYVHIAHDCVIGDYCMLANACQLAGHVHVQDYATLGGMTAVHQFTTIGPYVMVRGGSLVEKDIPPYSKVGKEPLRYCGVNVLGLQRRGFTPLQISTIQDIYRYLFYQKKSLTEQQQYIQQQFPDTKEKETILQFIEASQKGLPKRGSKNTKIFLDPLF